MDIILFRATFRFSKLKLVSQLVSRTAALFFINLYFAMITIWITVSVEKTINEKTIGYGFMIFCFMVVSLVNEKLKESVSCSKLIAQTNLLNFSFIYRMKLFLLQFTTFRSTKWTPTTLNFSYQWLRPLRSKNFLW